MDISKIKQLVKSNGDKFVFVEDGEPEVVVMSFHEYQRLAGGKIIGSPAPAPEEDLETGKTEFAEPHLSESAGLPIRPEDIRLEDLPI